MNAFILFLALIGVAHALRCYQGQNKASIPAEGSPMECLANSASCVLTLDGEKNTVTRACQISNCTLNGVVTNAPVCMNTTSKTAGAVTTHCCCYTDGCNAAYETNGLPAPADTNLAGSIAHRIEDFYDRDAAPAERTFMRRVVNEVYQHIDRESTDNN